MATAAVIRDMGETLASLLRVGIGSGTVQPGHVRIATPDEFAAIDGLDAPAISIFLHRVAVHPTLRNGPRRVLPDGSTTRPLLPVELGYLITPWAPRPQDEHLLAGHILQVLYDHAELGPSDLVGTSWAPGDSVQLVLESLPSEEHYRIWDTTEVAYRLSLTYTARVIGIEPAERVAGPPVVVAGFGPRP